MKPVIHIALIGDYNPAVIAHQAIPEALRLAASDLTVSVHADWVHTSEIRDAPTQLAEYDGVWCVPASPYANMDGALAAIRYAREHRIPFLGTCGGFQHAVIEFARNVCGIGDADHAETNPNAPAAVVTPLSCSLVECSEEMSLRLGSLLHQIYGTRNIVEQYHCSYGLKSDYASVIEAAGLASSAHDAAGAVRAMELRDHPFFVGTLFQSERRALRGETPPLARAFVHAAASSRIASRGASAHQ
jgi:CTP synthase (UTP-ammonia lyase)